MIVCWGEKMTNWYKNRNSFRAGVRLDQSWHWLKYNQQRSIEQTTNLLNMILKRFSQLGLKNDEQDIKKTHLLESI